MQYLPVKRGNLNMNSAPTLEKTIDKMTIDRY